MFAQKGSASWQGGQVLLVVILVIIVTSTIGLSVASRSITSLRTSTEEAESQKALSAAEAGIERVIQGNIPIEIASETNLNPDGTINSTYSTKIDEIRNSNNFIINGGSTTLDASGKIMEIIPNTIPKDEGADVWFVSHDINNGNPDYSSIVDFKNFLHLYWGSTSEACDTPNAPAAIQVIVITRDPSPPNEIKSYRYAYDSGHNSCSSRRSENKFTEADSGSFPKDYDNDGKTDITFGNQTPQNHLAKGIGDIVLMRVIPIYKDAVIGVDTCNPSDRQNGCTSLPSQGYVISSTGTSGQANRKITVFKGYPQTYLPYLSYGLFVAN